MDAAFAHTEYILGDEVSESERRIQRDFERMEVAVVDSKNGRARIHRLPQLLFIVNFHQGGEMQAVSEFAERTHFFGGKYGGNEQNGVGAVCGGFDDVER